MSVKTVPGALDVLNHKLGGNAGDIPASSTKEYALEKIYRTLGGEETLEGVNTTSEIIEKIAEVAEGGGGGSSELKTARVTIATKAIQTSIQYCSVLNGVAGPVSSPNASATYTNVLKNSIIMLPQATDSNWVTTGNVEYSTDMSTQTGFAIFIVTGDGEITYNI